MEFASELESFLKERGITKIEEAAFNEGEERRIQEMNDTYVKPVLREIEYEFAKYPNIKANLITSKKKHTDILENTELGIFRVSLLKFVYRIKYVKENKDIFLKAQFSTPDTLYNEAKEFKETEMKQEIDQINMEKIKLDFLNAFIKNVDLAIPLKYAKA